MREESYGHVLFCGYPGITPAHAGRILSVCSCTRRARDHPRACGKNGHYPRMRIPLPGSPPRMREEFHSSLICFRANGITPAHAGRIRPGVGLQWISRDHPRACGKNVAGARLENWRQGSPPRMREEFINFPQSIFVHRITPAHAGRIFTSTRYIPVTQDHPRACGKNASSEMAGSRVTGSPPRMREECCFRKLI